MIEHFHDCPVFLSLILKYKTFNEKNGALHPHLTECMCGGELNQKGKILINQAVRVKIDHLDNNVLGSRVPGRVLLAFSCRGRGGAANCCQLALQMDAPVCNLHSHVFNDGAPVYQRQRVIEFIRVCLYLY